MNAAAACLGAAACVFAGERAARRLRDRERTLSAWEEKLTRIEEELGRGGAALPALLRRGSARDADAFGALADRLEKAPAADADALLSGLIWPAGLTSEEKDVLAECARGLFSSEKEGQLRAVERARAEWGRFSLRAREIREKNAALYRKLGWLAGAAVFILLC